MPAHLNPLLACIRRRLFRLTPAAVIIVAMFIVIVVIGVSARALRAGKAAIEKKDAPAPRQAPPPRNNGNYIAPSRLWTPLRGVLNALGDRLEKPGKERLMIIGSLTRRNAESSTPFRLTTELPN